MNIYTANPTTKEFEGVSLATIDPVASERAGKEVYTFPANSTSTATPPLLSNEVAVLEDGVWVTYKDFRGTKVYSHNTKEVMTISQLGPLPFGYTLDVPGEYDSWGNNAWETDLVSELFGTKAGKLSELNQLAEQILVEATKEYPSTEQASWTKQEDQAEAWLAGDNYPTLLLDKIALARSITKDDLANKIITKAGKFELLAGTVIGKRQAIESVINLATSVEEVSLISLTII